MNEDIKFDRWILKELQKKEEYILDNGFTNRAMSGLPEPKAHSFWDWRKSTLFTVFFIVCGIVAAILLPNAGASEQYLLAGLSRLGTNLMLTLLGGAALMACVFICSLWSIFYEPD